MVTRGSLRGAFVLFAVSKIVKRKRGLVKNNAPG
jgi:hypothetical protein